MINLHRLIAVLMVLGAAAAGVSAGADAYIYSSDRQTINCGIVLVPGASQPLGRGISSGTILGATGGVGNLFYYLDSMTNIKPPGWYLDNPLTTYDPSMGGVKFPRSDPSYWTIDISAIQDLSMMQVLYFPASGTIVLDKFERDKLRKFVDGGGVLWVDNASPTSPLSFIDNSGGLGAFNNTANCTFFIQNFDFQLGGGGYNVPSGHFHPLLTTPFWISPPEVAALGAFSNSGCHYDPGGAVNSAGVPINTDVLFPVVSCGSATGPASIAANAYGSGRVVATADFVGMSAYMTYPAGLPSLKFAFNTIAWSSSWTHPRKDPRHSGSSLDTIGGTKLLENWSFPVTQAGSWAVESAPVIYKNVVFYSCGTMLYAFDLIPQEDLDQDGNWDEGIPETTSSSNYHGQDLIWQFTADSVLSAPIVVEAQDPIKPTTNDEAVLVTSATGKVYMLSAFPHNKATGQLLGSPDSLLPFNAWFYQVPAPASTRIPPFTSTAGYMRWAATATCMRTTPPCRQYYNQTDPNAFNSKCTWSYLQARLSPALRP